MKMAYKDKEKEKQHKKEHYQKNKDKIKEKHKEYREKNKEKIKEMNKEYRERNKDKLREKYKEYRERNKDKLREKNKELYNEAIKKISNFYGTGIISFFSGKQLKFKYELKNKSLDFCVIDHIDEEGSGKKDKLKRYNLYNYICNEGADLLKYQLLSSKENFIKEKLYSILNEIKENNSSYYNLIFKSYNKRFINNKYKLKKER